MLNSDIYIMIPVSGKLKLTQEINNNSKDEDIDLFNTKLNEQIIYACKEIVNKSLSRTNLGIYSFKYYENDNYEKGSSQWVNCSISLCSHINTDLGIMEIIFKNFEYEDSQVGAIFHTGHAIFKKIYDNNNNGELSINDLVKSFNLNPSGSIRVLSQNSITHNTSELKYLLSGETQNRLQNDFDIDNDFVDKNFKDLLEYDTYALYASDKAIVQLMGNYKKNFIDNIGDEIMPFYLVEFSMLQNATFARMNQVITSKLSSNGKIRMSESLSLIESFGKTISLWGNNIYKYYFDQKISDELTKAIGTNRLIDEYNKNKSYLEQLSNAKKGINDNIANCILGAITFLFTLINLYEIVINFHEYIANPSSLTISFSLIYIFWVIFLFYRSHSY